MSKNPFIDAALDSAKRYVKSKAKEVGNDVVDNIKNDVANRCRDIVGKIPDKIETYIDNKLKSGSSVPSKTGSTKKQGEGSQLDGQNSPIKENMTSAEEDAFIDNIPNRILNAALPAIKNPAEAIKLVNTLMQVSDDVAKFQEIQITKRIAIESQRQTTIAKIEMQKSLLMEYLSRTFDERRENFKKYFEVVDHALQTDNIQQLIIGLDNINKLATSSPFKDLSSIEQVGKSLDDPDKIWVF